jgi:hypothetical protein
MPGRDFSVHRRGKCDNLADLSVSITVKNDAFQTGLN